MQDIDGQRVPADMGYRRLSGRNQGHQTHREQDRCQGDGQPQQYAAGCGYFQFIIGITRENNVCPSGKAVAEQVENGACQAAAEQAQQPQIRLAQTFDLPMGAVIAHQEKGPENDGSGKAQESPDLRKTARKSGQYHRKGYQDPSRQYSGQRNQGVPVEHAEQVPGGAALNYIGFRVKGIVLKKHIGNLDQSHIQDKEDQEIDQFIPSVFSAFIKTFGEIAAYKDKERHMEQVDEIPHLKEQIGPDAADQMSHDDQENQDGFQVVKVIVSLFDGSPDSVCIISRVVLFRNAHTCPRI